MTSLGAEVSPATAPPAVLAAALFAVVVWGATPFMTKLAVAGLDPLAVGLLRTLLAGILAAPVLWLGRLALPRGWRLRGLMALSSLSGFVVFPLLYSLGQAETSAAHGALILAVLPLLTGLIAALLERQWPRLLWWLGAIVAIGGTVLLVLARHEGTAAGASLQGDLVVAVSTLAAATGYVAGARAARRAGTWAVTFWGLLLGALVLLPVIPFVLDGAALAVAPAVVWSCLLYLAGVTSILGYAAWYWALGQGGIGRIGITQYLQPLVGLVLAVAILGEVLTGALLLATALIIGGVALARGAALANPDPTNSR